MTVDILRAAVAAIIAEHIDALCACYAWRLVKGTSHETARKIVGRWSDATLTVFYALQRGGVARKRALAKQAKCSSTAIDALWGTTLARCQILVRSGGSGEPHAEHVFRRGRERCFDASGFRLRLLGG